MKDSQPISTRDAITINRVSPVEGGAAFGYRHEMRSLLIQR
ncbi:hypothetical protein [Allocoleopsis franciscana]|nr:hypothetical protein [Allocoleopsis franciscana]